MNPSGYSTNRNKIKEEKNVEDVERENVLQKIFHNIMDTLSSHIAVIDSNCMIVAVNKAWKKFGDENGHICPRACVGQNYLEVCENAQGKGSQEASEVGNGLKEIMAGNLNTFSIEYPCHSDRENRWFRVTIKKLSAAGKMWAVIEHHNISEMKLAELNFKNSENKLNGIIKSIPDVMCMMDKDLNLIWTNGVARKIFGENIDGQKCFNSYGGKNNQCEKCIVQKTFSDNATHSSEYTHMDINGRERTFFCTSSVVSYDNAGNPSEVMEIMHDITDKKESEKQIKKLSLAVEYSPASVVITDINGTIEYVNAKFTQVTGYSFEEAIGQNPRILSSGRQTKAYYSHLWKTILGGKEWKGEFANHKKNGSLYCEAASISPIFSENGKIINFVAIKEDITARKKMIKKLKEARDKAESATRAKSDFLATMSHEIRTPMNAILGMSHLLMESNLNDTQHNYISIIQSSADALLSIINDILDISKIEAGKIDLEKIEFQFCTIIDKIFNVLKFTAKEKGLELIYDFDHPIPLLLSGDPTRVSQVIMNLVSNALKYTEKGHVIVSSTIQPHDNSHILLKISVKDSGIGITAEQIKMLFRPFTQVDSSTTRKYGGTGLGLAIVKRFANLMDGDVEVQSIPGKCSTFSVTMKLEKSPCSKIPSLPMENLAGLRALIVESGINSGKSLQKSLYALGIDSTLVSSYEETLNLIKKERASHPWNLILFDYKLSEVAGRNFLMSISGDNFPDKKHESAFLIMHDINDGDKATKNNPLFSGITNKHIDFLERPVTPLNLVRKLLRAVESRINIQNEPKMDKTSRAFSSSFNRDFGGVSVLIVDDDSINREIVSVLLQKTGITVYHALDGESAVAMVTEHCFDLILMDIEMPIMDGIEATLKIRCLDVPWASRVPIVALTGHVMMDIKQKCIESGMNDHLAKPLKPKKLKEMLLKWLPSSEALLQSSPNTNSEKSVNNFHDKGIDKLFHHKEAGKDSYDEGVGKDFHDEWLGKDVHDEELDKDFHGEGTENRLHEEKMVKSTGQEDLIVFKDGLRYLNNNMTLYRKMLGVFVESFSTMDKELFEMLDKKDIEGARQLMHKIKSSSAMIGARKLSHVSGELEQFFLKNKTIKSHKSSWSDSTSSPDHKKSERYSHNETKWTKSIPTPDHENHGEFLRSNINNIDSEKNIITKINYFNELLHKVLQASRQLKDSIDEQHDIDKSRKTDIIKECAPREIKNRIETLLDFVRKHQPGESRSILAEIKNSNDDFLFQKELEQIEIIIGQYRFKDAEKLIMILLERCREQ
ncbi:putative Histidine kinase [Desulfamplus magnetovallimortis]|uniref:Sensory/regulatory protein RpfC n=1 Tax=Desulfamplus magnetovallimortis TaxID=1246637 RepID=A0A1W1HJG9_9BACT|nr:PAS domain S-box protein [Desulfamplus magnetovallimortis]SLM32555.1 putative Histidine kinase [Desulfamplus magnetovallimortis]